MLYVFFVAYTVPMHPGGLVNVI